MPWSAISPTLFPLSNGQKEAREMKSRRRKKEERKSRAPRTKRDGQGQRAGKRKK
jgi:hypothetical protein